jgi:hypothetical protein
LARCGAFAGRARAGRIQAESPSIKPQPPATSGPVPNSEQQAAIGAVTGADGFVPFLLEGVTGSGKTEVYLHAIAACLARGGKPSGAGAGNDPADPGASANASAYRACAAFGPVRR